MKEHPILFSSEMVRAILEGRKTMTRRIIKESFNGCLTNGGPHPCPNDPVVFHPGEVIESPFEDEPDMVMNGERVIALFHCSTLDSEAKCPYGKIGDILWVRETFTYASEMDENGEFNNYRYWYRADRDWKQLEWVRNRDEDNETLCDEPKWKPSIFMPRKASRISLEITDIKVERLHSITWQDIEKEGLKPTDNLPFSLTHAELWEDLWRKINGDDSYNQNPWVWAIEFKRL